MLPWPPDSAPMSIGSSSIARSDIAEIAPALDGLEDALQRDGAVFLEVGAGVAALSIALCETWPGLRVVALEPGRPALALAEAQVRSSAVGERIELEPPGSRMSATTPPSTPPGWPARSCRRPDVHEVHLRWQAPAFVVGRRPG